MESPPHWDYGILQDRGGIVVAPPQLQVSRLHRRTLSSYVACHQPLTALEDIPMTLFRMWRRVQNFQRWKKTTIPLLLNVDTGEVLPFSSYTAPPSGKWMLRRPLTLPESTLPLFLETPLIPRGLAVKWPPRPWRAIQLVEARSHVDPKACQAIASAHARPSLPLTPSTIIGPVPFTEPWIQISLPLHMN